MINSNESIQAHLIHGTTLKSKIVEITRIYAEAVARTYGPYGANTLIQGTNNVFATKDGWTVASNLTFGDDIPTVCLAKMILDAAVSVNLKVGDGTTTVIEAANVMNTRLINYLNNRYETDGIRLSSRQIEDAMTNAVNLVIGAVKNITNQIDLDNEDQVREVIQQVALIATNWNTEYSEMIADIYATTGNPIIMTKDSGSDKSTVEYIDGFEVSAELMLRDFYLTDRVEGLCKLNNPLVVMFDYAIPGKLFKCLSLISGYASVENRPFVVLAPGFTEEFVKSVRSYNTGNIRNKRPIMNMYMVKLFKSSLTDRDIIDDLSIILGAEPVMQDNTDVEEMFTDLLNAMVSKAPEVGVNGVTEDNYEDAVQEYNDNREMMLKTCYEYVNMMSGTCETLVANDKKLQVSGLTAQNEEEVAKRVEKITGEIDKILKEEDARSMMSNRIREKRVRLGKLHCKMGVINIGGYGSSNLAAKRAALDDAIKACQAAYENGYVLGGGYAIPYAITKFLINYSTGKYNGVKIDPLVLDFINIIRDAFKDVIKIICFNKYQKEPSEVSIEGASDQLGNLEEIIDCGMANGTPFNIITEQFDPSLIEPANEEEEILRGCMRLVLLANTSTQMLYNDYSNLTRPTLAEAKE